MFDVGFWELTLIMVVALVVIGPERLPRVVRTLGLWVGRARSAFNSVKADIDRELRAEELKSMLSKQSDMSELKRFREDLERDVSSDTGEQPAAAPPPPAAPDERDDRPVGDADAPPESPSASAADDERN